MREAEEFLVTGCQFLVTQNSKPRTQNFSKREAEAINWGIEKSLNSSIPKSLHP
jgi:hypothetical protein